MDTFDNRISILLVEDDKALSMGLEYALISEGFLVKAADRINSARDIMFSEQYDPDIIILDIMLPDGTGYDFCAELAAYRRNRSKPVWPVIFLSACDSEANIVMGLDGGADDYITKPFRVKELISRIKAVLRRNHSISTSTLSCGPITIDIQDHRAWKLGQELQLTVMEFRLLAAMMRNQGRVLSRQMLLQSLWDDRGEYIDDNTLSVHMSHLRDKLESDPGDPKLIQTVRGVGYRFCAEAIND
ncbi:MAG: response regulator transcription factor [Clostridiaceae bacterium]|nr:response regulator transcription factor [Clostridiaceae bacterium]